MDLVPREELLQDIPGVDERDQAPHFRHSRRNRGGSQRERREAQLPGDTLPISDDLETHNLRVQLG